MLWKRATRLETVRRAERIRMDGSQHLYSHCRTDKNFDTDANFHLLQASGLLHVVDPLLAGVQPHWSSRLDKDASSHEDSKKPVRLDGELLDVKFYDSRPLRERLLRPRKQIRLPSKRCSKGHAARPIGRAGKGCFNLKIRNWSSFPFRTN